MRTVLARRTAPLLLVTALIAPASGLVVPAAATAPGHLTAAVAGAYQPLNSTRIFDTRDGLARFAAERYAAWRLSPLTVE